MKNGETNSSGQPVRRNPRRARESPAARAGRSAGLIGSLGDSRTPKVGYDLPVLERIAFAAFFSACCAVSLPNANFCSSDDIKLSICS